MRVIWNGICDPTLHVVAIALMFTGLASVLNFDGSSSQESIAVNRCRLCLSYYSADTHCAHPFLFVASENPTD